MFVARFVAAAFGMVAERATLLRNKLRSKVAQRKSGVSSALRALCPFFLFSPPHHVSLGPKHADQVKTILTSVYRQRGGGGIRLLAEMSHIRDTCT